MRMHSIHMKQKIAIFMGGFSAEHSISLKSGQVVFDSLDGNIYQKFKVIISEDGWTCFDELGQACTIDKSDLSIHTDTKVIKPDCVFIAIHGNPGENGVLQSYLDMIEMPYTGCGAYQSALTFNKRDTLSVLKEIDIPCATSFLLNRGDFINLDNILSKVGLPCFVKANCSGSSYGVSKVTEKAQLQKAIETAFDVDDNILIESCLKGTEVSVGVITYQGDILALPITEIITDNEFFDFQAKYLGQSQEITPARISAELTAKVHNLAIKIFKHLSLSGFSRSEFIIQDGIPHFLEINTVPGLTKESILPQQADAAGIGLTELFGNAVQEALQKVKKLNR